MRKPLPLQHEFVLFIPDVLEEGTVYVSINYATTVHKCCCGCGREVVTPLSPADWRLTYDGETVSLYPSIGSWNLPCQSHYWISRDRAVWVPRWSREKIEAGRTRDRLATSKHFDGPAGDEDSGAGSTSGLAVNPSLDVRRPRER
jgi:hypothetical protein